MSIFATTTKPARRQGDGTGARPILLGQNLGRRQRPILAIDPAVCMRACDGIGTLRPPALHPLEIGKTRAVDVLVHHACGQKRRILRQRRRFERQLALLGVSGIGRFTSVPVAKLEKGVAVRQ